MTEPDASVNQTVLATNGERQPPVVVESQISLLLKQVLEMLIDAFEAQAGSMYFKDMPAQSICRADCPAAVLNYLAQLENLVAQRIKSGPWRIIGNELLLSVTPFTDHALVVVNAPLLDDAQLVGTISLILSNQTYTHFKHLALLPPLANGLGRFLTATLEAARYYWRQAETRQAHIAAAAEEQRGNFCARLYTQSLKPWAEVVENLDHAQKLLKTNPELLPNVLPPIRQTAQEAVAQARALLWESVPAMFRPGGLIPALEQYIYRLNKTEKFIVDAQLMPLPAEVADLVERAVFLIIQEAVNNIRRHAAASYVKITLSVRAGQLLVHIKDNGVGFNPAMVESSATPHYGLAAMRQEAERVGGILAINSETSGAGRGTVVTFSAPLHP